MQPAQMSQRSSHRSWLASDDGITLIEVMIVLVIVGILMGASTIAFQAARKGGASREARSVALIYQDAVDAYADDHRNVTPSGDITRLQRPSGKLYLRNGPPESVSDGTAVVANSAPTTGGRATVWVRYHRHPGNLAYWLVAYSRPSANPGSPFRPVCYASNTLDAPTPGFALPPERC